MTTILCVIQIIFCQYFSQLRLCDLLFYRREYLYVRMKIMMQESKPLFRSFFILEVCKVENVIIASASFNVARIVQSYYYRNLT